MKILKYSGVLLALFGAIIIMIFSEVYPPADNLVSAWVLWSALSVSLVLPLFALGVGFAFVSIHLAFISSVAFLLGFYIALINYNEVWFLFSNAPNAEQHFYLTLPIAGFCSGILLLVSKTIRSYLLIPFSFIIGIMVSITTKLTDPTFHDPIIIKLAVVIAFWIILSSMLSIRFLYREWFMIVIRIFASWLLAASLLYGGMIAAVKYGYFTPISKSIVNPNFEVESSFDDMLIPDFNLPDSNIEGLSQ